MCSDVFCVGFDKRISKMWKSTQNRKETPCPFEPWGCYLNNIASGFVTLSGKRWISGVSLLLLGASRILAHPACSYVPYVKKTCYGFVWKWGAPRSHGLSVDHYIPHQSCHEDLMHSQVTLCHLSWYIAQDQAIRRTALADVASFLPQLPVVSFQQSLHGRMDAPSTFRTDPECHILPLHHQTSPCPGIEAVGLQRMTWH